LRTRKRVGQRFGMRLGWILRVLMAVGTEREMEGMGLIVEGSRRWRKVMEGMAEVGGCSRSSWEGVLASPVWTLMTMPIKIFCF
jgi:hypothetical protein